MRVSARLDRIRRVLKKTEVRSLSRRYFIANSFDGVLTSLGVIIGAYLGGVTDGLTVIGICLGAAIGLGTSGIWSVWEIERAETPESDTTSKRRCSSRLRAPVTIENSATNS